MSGDDNGHGREELVLSIPMGLVGVRPGALAFHGRKALDDPAVLLDAESWIFSLGSGNPLNFRLTLLWKYYRKLELFCVKASPQILPKFLTFLLHEGG